MAGLKPHARPFVKAVFAVLAERAPTYSDTTDGFGRWTSRTDTDFVLEPRSVTADEACLERELIFDFPGVAERVAFRAAVAADTRLAPLLDKVVGSPLSASRVDVDGLERGLLWSVFRAAGSLRYAAKAFEVGYDDWLAAALAREVRLTVLVPLSAITVVGEIDLGDGITIGQLSDEEVESLLGARLVPDVFGFGNFVNVLSRAALRTELAMERTVRTGTDEDGLRAMEHQTRASDTLLEVIEALRVYKKGRVGHTGVAMRSRDGHLWTVPVSSGAARAPGPAMIIDAASEGKDIVRFWKHFRTARCTRAIDAAVRRFSYAGDRTRRDDQIVDLVAALEALLLSEIDNRTELKFRTSLRGALFIEGVGLTRRDVQKQLRRAYNVRSSVAHGDDARKGDLKSATDEQLTLDQFVAETEDLVRVAVRRAIDCVGSGAPWPPDWDALVVGEASYP